MNQTKQFTGFLSSTTNPGTLSLTIQSLTKTALGFAALYAVIRGIDPQTVTSQVQAIVDLAMTGGAAGFTLYHATMTAYGLVHKLLFVTLAKPVVTQPTAVPTAVPIENVQPGS